eukprot:708632-Alexandrium_andersonii.AAC.1
MQEQTHTIFYLEQQLREWEEWHFGQQQRSHRTGSEAGTCWRQKQRQVTDVARESQKQQGIIRELAQMVQELTWYSGFTLGSEEQRVLGSSFEEHAEPGSTLQETRREVDDDVDREQDQEAGCEEERRTADKREKGEEEGKGSE